MPKAFKPTTSVGDKYQGSEPTNYVRDQTTGQLVLKSGFNTRCVLPEMFKSAEFILKDNTAINTDTTIYTVPAGKVLLLLGANLNYSSQAATFGNAARLNFDINGTITAILRGYGDGSATGCAYGMSQNFASILVIPEGVRIYVSSASVNVRATGCVFGYIINNSEYFPAN